MRYSGDRPLWRQRKWWLDGIAFAVLFPLVANVLAEGAPPVSSPVTGYLAEVVAAMVAWGLVGWVQRLWRGRR